MKSSRRHELQHNVLGAEIGKIVGFFKKHGTRLSWAVLIAALVALVWVYFDRKADEEKAKVQSEFYRLRGLASLPGASVEELINGFRNLSQQDNVPWIAADSRLILGRTHIIQATQAGKQADKQKAYDEAKKSYQSVIEKFQDHPPYVAAAYLGLGNLAENRGDFDAAREKYQAVLKMSGLKGYPILSQARQAISNLDSFSDEVRFATTLPSWATESPKDGASEITPEIPAPK
jgi:tetratricopeptide (TPR) repeat protein